MSESDVQTAAPAPLAGDPAVAAGALLRKARQAQGLHIAALAASIKVSPRKLEALESGRLDALPDLTFARALALAVCRSLKIDPAPVLAQLPHQESNSLTEINHGLNAPFREKPGRSESRDLTRLISPAIWGPALVLSAAVLVYFVPGGWFGSGDAGSSVESPASAASEALPSLPTPPADTTAAKGAAGTPQPVGGAEVPPKPGGSPSSTPQAAVPPIVTDALLLLKTRSDSWVEVVDGKDQVLLARSIKPGEVVSLNGALPFKVKVGNAAATELSFRGQAVDLNALARDNVAKLELN